MKIIAHRGYWLTAGEKNSLAAFNRSVENGYGIETDVRDHNGILVIAHDVPVPGEVMMTFDEFLKLYSKQKDTGALLAINIKADGLVSLLQQALAKYKYLQYFTFDMSVPGLYFGYRNSGLRYYASVNEHMRVPVLPDECHGIWLDAYETIWYSMQDVAGYLSSGKEVCIVSPELHGRPHLPLWQEIREAGLHSYDALSICTDHLAEAADYFKP